jgi:hypothetical protein
MVANRITQRVWLFRGAFGAAAALRGAVDGGDEGADGDTLGAIDAIGAIGAIGAVGDERKKTNHVSTAQTHTPSNGRSQSTINVMKTKEVKISQQPPHTHHSNLQK